MGGKFMQEILLDNVSYSKLNNLITHATAYTCEEDKVIDELGIWKREDIIEAIRSGKKISRASVTRNYLGIYLGQRICHVITIETEGEIYLINSDYRNRLEKEDMIEMNEWLKHDRTH
jgi:hypothetical protein